METIIKTYQVKASVTATAVSPVSGFWKNAEVYRFAIIPMLLVIVSCMGGIAAGFGAKDDAIRLGLIAFPTIITLAFTLAVAPMRSIIWSAVVAVLLQIAVLIFSIIKHYII